MSKIRLAVTKMSLPVNPVSNMSSRTYIWLYLAALSFTVFSVMFLDRNIATWMHQHSHASYIFKPLSQMPLLFEILSAMVIISCVTPKGRKHFLPLALSLGITLILATIFRVGAKFIFGRTWPETWIHTDTGSNPSWINDAVEGFHPFAEGLAYNSFPSGHALFTYALVSVFWWRFPQLKVVWIMAMLGAVAGQIGQNYHYLGDLIAGATLGVFSAQISIRIVYYLVRRANR